VRAAAETIGQVVSLLLISLEESEVFSQRLVRNVTLRAVVDRFASPLPLPQALAAAHEDLLYLVDAAGAVLHFAGRDTFIGQTPPQAQAAQVLMVMRSLASGDLLALDELRLRFPELADAGGAGGGALLLPLSPESDDAILWFRPELNKTVTWGGDPTSHGSIDVASGRISPRTSFAAWERTVSGRGAPWTEADLAIARELRTAIHIEIAQRAVVALKATTERLGLLAEHSGVVVALSDLEGTRLFVSPASERVLGWRPEEMVDRNALEFIHPDDHKVLREANIELLKGSGQSSATYRFRRPDGSWLWVDGHARLRDGMNEGIPPDYIVVLRDATERKEAEVKLQDALDRMEQMANTDGLTGLANRRHLDVAAIREWRRCARESLPLSVLMVDADRFKLFNDRYGHLLGDDCLRAIAAQLTAVARRPGDVAARYGGEEFVLLMPNTAREGALSVAERLCQAVRDLDIKHEGNGDLGIATISIGLATAWPGDSKREFADVVPLIAAADVALYGAKSGGRNRE
jgi:diguanylate cyclase (GGDEF)-like protein/PAS domain S-box-containing protein